MIRHYVLTLTGSAQRLSSVLADMRDDLPVRAITLQPDGGNANPIYVGGYETGALSSSNYGFRLEIGAAGVPPAPFVLDPANAPMKLSDWYVLGTNTQKLTVLVVT